MKKLLSLILCMLMLFSLTGVVSAYNYPEINDPARLPWNVFGSPVIESGNTVRYAPWFFQYILQSKYEAGWSLGSEGGQVITAIASAPSNPDYLLFGTDVGGSSYSHDGGNTWFKVREGDATWSVSSYIFDPEDENVCYAAQGWKGITSNYVSKAEKSSINGIYKSTDGGVTWKMCLEADFINVRGSNLLAFDNEKNLYALTKIGVMKSPDGGDNWENLGNAGAVEFTESMAISKDGKKIICAVGGGEAPGLHISLNNGLYWEVVGPEKGVKCDSVTIDPLNDSHWVGIFSSKLYETFDNGSTWSVLELDNATSTSTGTPSRVEFAKKASSNGIPNLYVRLNNVCYPQRVSHDYGKTWITAYIYSEHTLLDNNNGYMQEAMWGDDTDPDVVYASIWDTVYKSENGGVDFFPCSSGAGNTMLTWVSFGSNGTIWYGLRDKNVAVSNEPYFGGDKFPTVRSLVNYPRDGGNRSTESILIDEKDPNHVYCFVGGWTKQYLEETFDGGESWIRHDNVYDADDNIVLQYHNENDNIIYASAFTSRDRGKTWNPNSKRIYKVSPVDNDVVFSYDSKAKEAFISFDTGQSWESIGKTTLAASAYGVDSRDKNTFYIGTQSHSMVKFTYGEEPEVIKFKHKYNGHTDEVTDIEFDPKNPDHMLVSLRSSIQGSKSIGLLESYDHGKTFEVVVGMPGVRYLTDINFEPYSNRVWIGSLNGVIIYEPDNFKVFLENSVTVEFNGNKLSFDVSPEIVNDRTFVPMRKIFEELGATVTWDGGTQTVTAVKGDKTIKLKIGSTKAYVNDSEIVLDAAPYITYDRTLVPLRFVTESLDGKVQWIDTTRTVILESEIE